MKQPFSNLSISSLLCMALVISGCQTGTSLKTAGLDNPGFMTILETYTHCTSTSDIGETQQDMGTLSMATQANESHDGFVLPMPQQIERFVSTPANRLAVDIHAMAASCSLHAGQVAFSSGRIDLARAALTKIVTLHKENQEPTYYLAQAHKLLAEMDNGVQISLRTP
ncbi:MAG: hypothetical protein IT389_09740 [Nitrospira sp.]|nr:hypothetical protein [Nitrospira sp.]